MAPRIALILSLLLHTVLAAALARARLPKVVERAPTPPLAVALVVQPSAPPAPPAPPPPPKRRRRPRPRPKPSPVPSPVVTPPVAEPTPRRLTGISFETPETPSTPTPGATGRITRPRSRGTRPPPYPPRLRARGIEGRVELMLDLDANGRVVRVTLVTPSPHEAFNRAARTAAKRLRFTPAKTDGVAVPARERYTVRFVLRDTP